MHRALAAVTLLPISLFPRPALAQQTISEFFMGASGQLIFCEDDIVALDAAAQLTDDQKEAARLILKAAARKIQTTEADGRAELAKKHRWETMYNLPEEERAAAQEELSSQWARGSIAIAKKSAAIELEALRDLHSLLTPDQTARAWPRFERDRRRLIAGSGFSWGLGIDPRSLIAACKLDVSDTALAEPLLIAHDEAIDALILRRMSRATAFMRLLEQGGKFDVNDEDWQQSDREIARLNLRTNRELENLLSDAARERFLRLRVGSETQHAFSRPSKDLSLQKYLTMPTITSVQRDRMQQMARLADNEVYEIALSCVRATDEASLSSELEKPEVTQERWTKATESVAKSLAELDKNLRALLTPEQIDELDGKEGSKNFERMFSMPRRGIPLSPWVDEEPTVSDPAHPAAAPVIPHPTP
jgi:hypothetical protein